MRWEGKLRQRGLDIAASEKDRKKIEKEIIRSPMLDLEARGRSLENRKFSQPSQEWHR